MFYKLIFNGNDKRKKISEETKTFEGLSSFAKKVFGLSSNDIGFLYCGSEDVSAYEISCDEDLEYVLEIVNAFEKKLKFIDIKVIENFEMSPENPDRFSMAGGSEFKKSQVPVPEEKIEVNLEEITPYIEQDDILGQPENLELSQPENAELSQPEDVELSQPEDDVKEEDKSVEVDISDKLKNIAEKITSDFIESTNENKDELMESQLNSLLNETFQSIKKDIKKKSAKNKKKKQQQEKLLKRYQDVTEKTKKKIDESLVKINNIFSKLTDENKEKTTPFNVIIKENNSPCKEFENEILMMENTKLQDKIEELTQKCISMDIEMSSLKSSSESSHKHIVETTHRNIICDHCTTADFQGRRYKCLVCPDFDLCESCEQSTEHKHPMVRMVDSTDQNRKLNWMFDKLTAKPWMKKAFNIELTEEEQKKFDNCNKRWKWRRNNWNKQGPFKGKMTCPFKKEEGEKRRSRNPFKMFGKPYNPFIQIFSDMKKGMHTVPEDIKNQLNQMGATIVKSFDPKTEAQPELNENEIIVEVPIKKNVEKEDFVMKKEVKNEENEKETEEKFKNKKIEERKEYVKLLMQPNNINDDILHFFVVCNLDLDPATFYKAVKDQKQNLIA
jgi:hypothetical protein